MGEKNMTLYIKCLQSWRGASGWALWTLQPPLEDSLASALASASSPSSRSSTGSELEFSEPYLARSNCEDKLSV